MKRKKKQFKPPQEIQEDLIGSPEEIAASNLAILDDNFIYANTFIQQVGYLCENMIRVKYRQIGKVFGVSRQKAQICHMKYLRGEGIDGRPPSLTPEELENLKNKLFYYIKIQYIHQFVNLFIQISTKIYIYTQLGILYDLYSI